MKQTAYLLLLLLGISGMSYGRHHHRISQEQVQTQKQAQLEIIEGEGIAAVAARAWSVSRPMRQTFGIVWKDEQLRENTWEGRQARRQRAEEQRQEMRAGLTEAEQRLEYIKAKQSDFHRQASMLLATNPNAAAVAYQHAINMDRQRFFAEQEVTLLTTRVQADNQARWRDQQEELRDRQLFGIPPGIKSDRLQNPAIANSQNNRAAMPGRQNESNDKSSHFNMDGPKWDKSYMDPTPEVFKHRELTAPQWDNRFVNPEPIGPAGSQNNRAAMPGRQSDSNGRRSHSNMDGPKWDKSYMDPTPEAFKHRELTAPQWDNRFLNPEPIGPAGTFKKESNNKDYVNQTFTFRDNAGQPSNKSGGVDSPSGKSRSEEERERREHRRDEK